MSSKRRHFSAEQKAQVVRRHLAGKEAVSDLADELQIQPSVIHLWVKQVLEQAERAFEKSPGRPPPGRGQATAASSSSKPSSSRRTKSSPNSWRRTFAQKKPMGNSDRSLGSP